MKLKWWHWALIGFVGLIVIVALTDPTPPRPRQSGKAAQPQKAAQPEYSELDPTFRSIARDMFAMSFDERVDPNVLPEAARAHCGSKQFCTVMGWVEAEYAPRGFPLTDREASRQVFAYSVNRSSGFEQVLWDCRRWRRATTSECMAMFALPYSSWRQCFSPFSEPCYRPSRRRRTVSRSTWTKDGFGDCR